MPSESKRQLKDKCPKCGTFLVEIIWEFDPFPGEKGSLERQISQGCGNCGWQKVISTHVDYDPAISPEDNRRRESHFPKKFRREDFSP